MKEIDDKPLYSLGLNKRGTTQMTTTVKQSGYLIEVTEHNKRQKSYKRNGGRKTKVEQCLYNQDDKHSSEVKLHSIKNTIRTFKRYVFANFSYGFTMLTLTFNTDCDFDIADVSICREKFNLYWRNLSRTKALEGIDFHYLGVQEFHNNGHIHFHILCHLPKRFNPIVKTKWKHGHADLRHSKKDPLSTKKIANYLSKGIFDDRLANEKHRYLWSRGLKKPIIFTVESNKIKDYLLQRKSEIWYSYESEYGFRHTAFISEVTRDELESFAANEVEADVLMMLEKLETINESRGTTECLTIQN